MTGTLTLDAQGDGDARFVFNIPSALTTAPNSAVRMINAGSGCNVWWRIGSSATLDVQTEFVGNILALTSITLNTAASIVPGRALARNGSVTLDTNLITSTTCTGPGGGGPPGGGEGDEDTTTISVTKTATAFCEKRNVYDWILEKKAYPTYVQLDHYGKASVNYKLCATRLLVKSKTRCTVRGEICVKNTGDSPTVGPMISDTVQARVGTGPWKNIASTSVDTSQKPFLLPGEEFCYPYEVAFTPLSPKSSKYGPPPTVSYRNVGCAKISNLTGAEGPRGVCDVVPFSLPTHPATVDIDAEAKVVDHSHRERHEAEAGGH